VKPAPKAVWVVIVAVGLLVVSLATRSGVGVIAAAEQRLTEEWETQQMAHVNARSVAELFPLGR
jgi:uncharacterized membrane protein (Fun14 family)